MVHCDFRVGFYLRHLGNDGLGSTFEAFGGDGELTSFGEGFGEGKETKHLVVWMRKINNEIELMGRYMISGIFKGILILYYEIT